MAALTVYPPGDVKGVWSYIALSGEGLALFRRGLGLLCALDACLRLSNVSFFLSDLGVLPRSLYFQLFEHSYAWSLYSISGRVEFAVLLLLATAGLGVYQMLGRSARWVRVVLWVLIVSVQNRNPALLDSSDDLLKLLLFWDIFLAERKEGAAVDAYGAAELGLQFQLSLTLLFTALSRSRAGWAVAAQWSGSSWAATLLDWWWLERVALLAALAAVWLRPVRLGVLAGILPVLLLRGVIFHPVFPLTLAVALSALYTPRGREVTLQERGTRKPLAFSGAAAMSLLALGLLLVNAPAARRPLVILGQGLGTLQSWDRVYPLGSAPLVQVVAQDSGGRELWRIDRDSTRRERLFADRVGGNGVWSLSLGTALARRLDLASEPALFLRSESLTSDFTRGPGEVRALNAP